VSSERAPTGARALVARAGAGGLAGATAYLIGYLVVYVWQSDAVARRLRGFNFLADVLGGDPVPTWKGVAWLFYNAHSVRIEVPAAAGSRSIDFLARGDAFPALLYAVPPLVLLVVEGGIAHRLRATTVGVGARDGASLAAGYLPLAVAVALLSTHAVGGATVAPDPVTAALLAGLVYPLLFGGAGAAAGAVRG